MYKYERIIYWSKDDEAFIVEVPELPGCMADGVTAREALENASSSFDQYIIRSYLYILIPPYIDNLYFSK